MEPALPKISRFGAGSNVFFCRTKKNIPKKSCSNFKEILLNFLIFWLGLIQSQSKIEKPKPNLLNIRTKQWWNFPSNESRWLCWQYSKQSGLAYEILYWKICFFFGHLDDVLVKDSNIFTSYYSSSRSNWKKVNFWISKQLQKIVANILIKEEKSKLRENGGFFVQGRNSYRPLLNFKIHWKIWKKYKRLLLTSKLFLPNIFKFRPKLSELEQKICFWHLKVNIFSPQNRKNKIFRWISLKQSLSKIQFWIF